MGMSVRQVGERSTTYWIVSVLIMLIPGLGVSWLAWSVAAPFELRLRPGGLPEEYLLLTCSLLCLYCVALVGGWVVIRNGEGRRGASVAGAMAIGAVTLYGVIAALVFALSTGSEWSLAAVLPLGLIAYFHVQLFRSGRGSDASSGEHAASTVAEAEAEAEPG